METCPPNRHRLLVIVLSAALGLLLAVLPGWARLSSASSTVAIAPTQAATPDQQSRLQSGLESYQAGQLTDAIAHWQEALTDYQTAGNAPYQALTLSYLSLAYQQLEQWPNAEQAIATALTLLQQQPPTTPTDWDIQAKVWNTQGHLDGLQGRWEDALTHWQQAAIAYTQVPDATGLLLAEINQATALQRLGLIVQAEQQLEALNQRLQGQTDPVLRASGLRSLGNAYRGTGKLRQAQAALQESVAILERTDRSTEHSAALLDLGNTERALAEQAIAIGNVEEANQHRATALRRYEEAAIATVSPLYQLQARLNRLSLLIQDGQSTTAVSALEPLYTALTALPTGRRAIELQLNFAHTVLHLYRRDPSAQPLPLASMRQLLSRAAQQAHSLRDGIAEAYAIGQLGELYELTGQWDMAQSLTEQALVRLDPLQARASRYRWEWQLGRLHAKQWEAGGKQSGERRQQAIAAYQEAVDSLQSIRNDLLLINADVQFSFRDDVEPIYREFVELLLTTPDGRSPDQASLQQAIQQIDALQLAELENFLGCELDQSVAISEIEADPTAAKLYPMILPQRLAVVLELPGADQPLQYYEVRQDRQTIEATLEQLRRDLSVSNRTPQAVRGLRQVYQWLIAPFQPTLANHPAITTLVFVLDGNLRNIPMAALYDGDRYLISTYAVAIAPRLRLFKPSIRPAQLNVFLGGVGKPQTLNNRSFPEIEYLTPELETIQQLMNANQPILNEHFTKATLEQQFKAGAFSAIHLKTHGVFSSAPEETFIVAYRELITGRDLGRLVQTSRSAEGGAIDLLVLSACSTATGDNRAVLGLAGTAVQAGTRSVVSTLWEAQDVPNTQLMIRFYQELLNPATSRAQALRLAQLHLLNQGYRTPHIWATYVLVGNWL